VLGYLGLTHARQARFDQARPCLDSGEALLRAMSDRLSLGVLLCCRAEAAHIAGDLDAAKGALAEAESLATATGAGSDSSSAWRWPESGTFVSVREAAWRSCA